VALIVFRPQQRGEGIAAVRLARQRQISQQRERFARIDCDRMMIEFDPG
jgi:hypothetical protein